jgi:hypothetical protein
MLLYRAVPGEEPLVVFIKLKMLLRLLINVNRNAALQRKGVEIAKFYPIAVGKCSTRLLNSR